jgi:hypothetical protein
MQGKKGKYAFEVEENENRQFRVINTETGEVQIKKARFCFRSTPNFQIVI